jgi:hypothetical protein
MNELPILDSYVVWHLNTPYDGSQFNSVFCLRLICFVTKGLWAFLTVFLTMRVDVLR